MRQIEPNTFICADSEQVLRDLPTGFCGMVLTDPPYGIGAASASFCNGTSGNKEMYFAGNWDSACPNAEMLKEIRRISNNQIVWGGNYFANELPPSKCWLVWDKRTGENSYADCELAWTNLPGVVRKFEHLWLGALAKDTDGRYHPTQKPVPLFVWCIVNFTKPGDLIVDPYSGCGTLALACHKTGRRFICIEREPKYVEIAQQRYQNLISQTELFGAGIMESGATSANTGSMPCQQESLDF